MSKSAIIINSKDRDFAEPLAEQVKARLGAACHIIEPGETPAQASLVVMTENARTDYGCPVLVVKNQPVKMQELLDDIAAAVQKQSADEAIALGQGYQLQVRQKKLLHAGGQTDVTDKEVQILQMLAGAQGKVVTKEHLLKEVWGFDSALDTHTLETHIYRLRGKFRELADDDMIVAENGGYALAIK